MNQFLKAALQAAEQSSKLLRRGFQTLEKLKVTEKPTTGLSDVVSKFDYLAQNAIIKIISQNFPEHSILSEEGIDSKGSSGYRWIIDPLDGTNNFSRGIPNFAVSIALMRKDKIILGVVSLPYENEIYWTTEKTPTHLNNRKVRVGKTKQLRSATVGISMLRSKEAVALGTRTFVKLMKVPVKPRVFGAVAADLARVSSGKLDAIVFNHSNLWDIAAGIFLVQKAGGKISSVDGKHWMESKQLVASNIYLYKPLLKILRK